LWVRYLSTGREEQLTQDGAPDFGYATDNSGWKHSDRAIVSWSPDSTRIATYQQDQRGVGEMYLVKTQPGRPTLDAWKYALPGDEIVPKIERVIIDVDARRIVRLHMPPEERRSAHCYDLDCGPNGSLTDVQWSEDGLRLAFVSVSRDHRRAQLRVADAATGAVQDILDERQATFYESATAWAQKAVNWRYLWATQEVIWFSQRDDWGHLYLYDANTHTLERRITGGRWNVVDLLRVDEKHRQLYLVGVGRERGRDPYFAHLYRVRLDGRHLELLTPENADHDVSLSPSGDYFVDSYSTPGTPPVTVLRKRDGKLIRALERADISRLVKLGWQPPIPITVKARDGVTDLYGLLFRPTHFDESTRYPVVNRIYPGPQIGSVGRRTFAASRDDAQSIAELGFVVVTLDGMGTSLRSKTFQDVSYGRLDDNTLPDQIAGMRELAQRYPWIDLTRAGICGHSGGGYAAAAAMLRYPDFFRAGVSESGNHDQRGYEGDWGEQYAGLLTRNANGTSSYDGEDNASVAKNLKGHLLLMHGTGDDNVPLNLTLLLVDALIRANKDFDLLLLPNQPHMYGGEAELYATRRRWDYLVRHLLDAEPPAGYELHRPVEY
ncbi:MAG TPA: DPP IV N-terminal domain-containing protein, partial [Steroidobacteraceae bacterium]|nr:DPP IV N-terminal domain-containing protein [Steroidobacteraceae bacterium]